MLLDTTHAFDVWSFVVHPRQSGDGMVIANANPRHEKPPARVRLRKRKVLSKISASTKLACPRLASVKTYLADVECRGAAGPMD